MAIITVDAFAEITVKWQSTSSVALPVRPLRINAASLSFWISQRDIKGSETALEQDTNIKRRYQNLPGKIRDEYIAVSRNIAAVYRGVYLAVTINTR